MKFTLVATAKDEGPYLFEWVAWHRMIGFDDIILFQNDSSDGTHEILTEMQAAGLVRYRYNRAPRGKHQIRAYTRATKQTEYQAADYVMALDLDEFLVVHVGAGNVRDFVAAAPDFDYAMLNWRHFGSSGHARTPEGLVAENFIMSEYNDTIKHHCTPFKSLFRRDRFERPGVHVPLSAPGQPAPRRVNGSGLREGECEVCNFRVDDPQGRRLAQVNHYIVKDAESFVLKNAKGSAHQADRAIDRDYWCKRNKNQCLDRSMARRAGKLRAAMARMDAETGGRLSALTAEARAHHRARFAELMNTPDARALFEFCRDRPQLKGPERLSLFAPRKTDPQAAPAARPDAHAQPAI